MGALAIEAQRPGGPGAVTAVDLDKDPFRGVTTDGTVQSGLFSIRATAITTKPVMDAATRFVAALTPEQLTSTTFPANDSEWRR